MECDSMHASIERQLHGKNFNVPKDYEDIILHARKHPFPYNFKYHTFETFKQYSSINSIKSIRPGKKKGHQVVTNLRVLKYEEGKIYYKTSFADSYEQLPHRIDKAQLSKNASSLYKERIPISTLKFNHLQELKKVIPSDHHTFYDNLIHL